MRILLLVHAFNSLTQRVHLALERAGHELSVEFDINDGVTEDAVTRFQPDVVLAPFLKRAIPASVWRHHLCLVLHPGPRGDRGPSALDWAIQRGETHWGVTVIQAVAGMDEGPVWAEELFDLPARRKSAIYRHEVTDAGVKALLDACARFAGGEGPLHSKNRVDGRGWQPLMRQSDRAIDWAADDTATVLRKLDAADGSPGIEDECLGGRWRWYGAWPEPALRGDPGAFLATRDEAVCRATRDGAVWMTHARSADSGGLKLPAARALGNALGDALPALPESVRSPDDEPDGGWQEIRYSEHGPVAILDFEFYNGAMNTEQCRRLLAAYREALERPTRVIVLAGGRDFWSNGMHLHCIEAASSPADESWRNINAIDDLAEAVLNTRSHLTVAALHGNAGAGGVFLAQAADRVWARDGVVLNPHYRNMGNLYGSEYWTYLLPRRIGVERAESIMAHRLPLDARGALDQGLLDRVFNGIDGTFRGKVIESATRLAGDGFEAALVARCARRDDDEAEKPLSAYRAEELDRMRLNFYGFDPSFHVARHRFVRREPHAWTPLYLARHRRLDYRPPPAARA